MRKRLFSLLAAGTIVVAACGGATPTKAPTAAPSAGPAATPAPSTAPAATPAPGTPAPSSGATAAPTPAASATPIDITTTTYKPEPVGNTGGKLLLGEWQPAEIPFWGYYDNQATGVEAGMGLYSLWTVTPDFKYIGQLATNTPTVANGGVTIVGDGMDVKVELVPGALWSDGQPMTCADIEGTWKWQIDPGQVGNVQGAFGWEDISGVDGGTGSSCVIHYKKQFEAYLTLFAPLLPKHYIETVPVKDASTGLYQAAAVAKAVWSGPYMPVKWTLAQINYVPNPKYWETIKKAKSPFDEVIFKYYESADAEIAGFKNGEVDVAMNFNHNDLGKLDGIDPASIQADTGLTYEQHSWNRANLQKKFGDDGPKMMEAFKLATDKQAIIDRIIGGRVTATCNYVSPLAWFYKEIPCYQRDVVKANQVLDDLGWARGADGLRSKDGVKLELLACTSAARPYRIDTLTLLAVQFREIGATIIVNPVPSAKLFGAWNTTPADTPCNTTHGNFDVAEFAWVATPDPLSVYLLYKSNYDPSEGDHSGSNYIRVKEAGVDEILDTAKASVDLNLVKEQMWKLQDIYVDPANNFPEVALYNWQTVQLVAANFKNVLNNTTAATNTWNIEEWWLSK